MSSPTDDHALYATLNLPVSASTEEIRERYKSLAILLHPDKQHDEEAKEIAGKKFHEIQRAYEVLNDPEKRAIYDAIGESGLSTKWAVGQKFKSKDEIRAEYIRLSGATLESNVNSRGKVTCTVDATSMFDRHGQRGSWPEWFASLRSRVSDVHSRGLAVQHGVEHAVSDRTTIKTTGIIKSNPIGKASGNIYGTVRHQFSPRLAFEASAAVLTPQRLSLNAQYAIEETTLGISTHLSPQNLLIFPPTTISCSRRLFASSPTRGTISLGLGPSILASSFTLGVSSPAHVRSQAGGWSTQMLLSPGNLSLAASYGCGVGIPGVRVTVGAELSTAGGLNGVIEGQALGKEENNTAFGVAFGAGGISLTIKLSWLGQRLVVPILLTEYFEGDVALFAVTLPSGLFYLAHHFVLQPRRRARIEARLRALREESKELTVSKRKEAEGVVKLLKPSVARKVEAERAKGGLIIQQATYSGTLSSPREQGNPFFKSEEVDVTIPLQSLVQSGQLVLQGGWSKAGLLGFYDPIPGGSKRLKLRIHYTFGDRPHFVEVDDKTELVIPQRAHALE